MVADKRNKKHDRRAVIGIALAVVVGVLVAFAGGVGSVAVGGWTVFGWCALLAFAMNIAAYIPAQVKQTEVFFDLTGALTYLTVVAVALLLVDGVDARAILAACLVMVWALRLGSFLFLRVRRSGGDARFDRIKTDPLQFCMTWVMQGLWVLLTVSCALGIITSEVQEPLGVYAVVGLALWLAGFSLEVVADRQKSAFRARSENSAHFIHSGLWAWSRHPNYFGEVVLWAGMFVLAMPILAGWRWALVISPVFVYLLLTKISGIGMLERRGMRKWGDDPAYHRYLESTPIFVPRPPR